ncbi:hypothetical protein JAAARDRAFT_200984 [Jaapia argillacea MUCL 33604]|uniref:F-box domain-containing protein n=1 Tax=Jaapia argillacea MUCL 33604 TaxID=933084 RepID=A0A067P635_9AGAM|nr:hypothetical protein JAAARDRAFT_200984 [Jaapia argillacea MUCL 33604]
MSAVQTVMSSADLLPIILRHMDTAFTFDTNGYMPKDLADIQKQVMGLSVEATHHIHPIGDELLDLPDAVKAVSFMSNIHTVRLENGKLGDTMDLLCHLPSTLAHLFIRHIHITYDLYSTNTLSFSHLKSFSVQNLTFEHHLLGHFGFAWHIFQNFSCLDWDMFTNHDDDTIRTTIHSSITPGTTLNLTILRLGSVDQKKWDAFDSFLTLCPNLVELGIQKGDPPESNPLSITTIPRLDTLEVPTSILSHFLPRHLLALHIHGSWLDKTSMWPIVDTIPSNIIKLSIILPFNASEATVDVLLVRFPSIAELMIDYSDIESSEALDYEQWIDSATRYTAILPNLIKVKLIIASGGVADNLIKSRLSRLTSVTSQLHVFQVDTVYCVLRDAPDFDFRIGEYNRWW